MFCSKCGAQLEENARFCVICGAPVKRLRSDSIREEDLPERTEGLDETVSVRRPEEERREENVRRTENARRTGTAAPQNRNSGNAPQKKSMLIPILLISAVALAAVALLLFVQFYGKRDGGSEAKEEKNKTESSAEISEEKESGSAQSSEKDDEDKDFWNLFKGDEDEADENNGAAASSEASDSTAAQSSGSQETASEPEQAEAEPEPEVIEIPKDFDSFEKVLKTVAGIELNLVSSDVSDYPTVRLYYSYNDSFGEPVTITNPVSGIKESIAGGAEIERTVRRIEQLEGNQGISIDIIADKSGSMSSDMEKMQDIMAEFVRNMDFSVGDKAELIAFDSYIMYMCTYTQDPALLQNGIYNMTAHGDTALYDAIAAGITNASYQRGARCVIAFTDGEDNRSVYTPEEIINMSIDKEVPVYIIGMGGAVSSTLTYICEMTGGAYWNIYSISDMRQVMETIYSHQKSMYCIEYESDKKADPYAERTVTCILSDDELNGSECRNTFTATEALKEQHHESRYELIKADVSWTEANDLCIAKGGHLVTITSPEEQNKIVSMAEKAGLKYIWIGGYTSVRNNTAYGHWVTGEPFDYTAWYPGEPSRSDSMDNEPEFYIMLWNVEGQWSWNDQRNVLAGDPDLPWFAGNMGYVIEYEN